MNKKVFSGIILSSVISISACQTEKTEKVEIDGKNQGPEKVLIVQEKTQKSVIEKIQTANEDISEKMQELDKKLIEIQKEYEEKNKK